VQVTMIIMSFTKIHSKKSDDAVLVLGNKSPDSQNNNKDNNNHIVKPDEDDKNSYSTVQDQNQKCAIIPIADRILW
jgi:hypothetical protein